MGNRLRNPDQGADTIVWLCVAKQARDQPSGCFFQGEGGGGGGGGRRGERGSCKLFLILLVVIVHVYMS